MCYIDENALYLLLCMLAYYFDIFLHNYQQSRKYNMMKLDIISEIQSTMHMLTKSQVLVAQALLENPNFFITHSITEIAEKIQVTPPTITRFCYAIGLKGVQDLKIALANNDNVGQRYLQKENSANTDAEVIYNVISKAQNALYILHENIDVQILHKIVTTLHNANMVYIFSSGGGSSFLGHEIEKNLTRLGVYASARIDANIQAATACTATTNDVIFATSISGNNKGVVQAAKIACQRGAKVIALTRKNSPVANTAHIVLDITLLESRSIMRPSSSRIVFLAVIDIIINCLAINMGDKAKKNLETIKQHIQ